MRELLPILQPLEPYQLPMLLGFMLVFLLLFIWVSASLLRIGRYTQRIKQMLTATSGEGLEKLIQECLTKVKETSDQLNRIESQLQSVAEQQQLCLQKVGLVRYDAYDDVHGKQSFSLALLNAQNSGAVITGLFGRTDARCYGKPILHGKSEHALSEEESQAMEVAMHRVEVPSV